MVFALALMSLCFLLVNVDAEGSKQKDPPPQLYEEFFALIKKGLNWNVTMAKQARRKLRQKKEVKGYKEVFVKREFASPLSTGEEVLLTLEKIWIRPAKLEQVKGLRPGSNFGCSYAYNLIRPRREEYFVKVLCFFKDAYGGDQQ